jgi:hypothetical protein
MPKTLALIAATIVVAAVAVPAVAGPLKGYSDEAAAERACRSDVVWANPNSKDHIYHVKGSRWYANTKIGTYVCQASADRHGWRRAENE